MQVRELQPAVYFYCKHEGLEYQELIKVISPLLRWGGETSRSDAAETENFVYLHHIIRFYDRLPDHVLFSQAQPEDKSLVLSRMQVLLQLPSSVLSTLFYSPERFDLSLLCTTQCSCNTGI